MPFSPLHSDGDAFPHHFRPILFIQAGLLQF
jgi:hypothetical protein